MSCGKRKCADCPAMVKACQMINGRCSNCDNKHQLAEKQSKVKISAQVMVGAQTPNNN